MTRRRADPTNAPVKATIDGFCALQDVVALEGSAASGSPTTTRRAERPPSGRLRGSALVFESAQRIPH
jgi:hypothetical protein